MKGELLALMAAALWGIAPIFDKLAISGSGVSPFLANVIRSIGAFTILTIIVLFLRDFDLAAFNVKRIACLLIAGSIAGGIAMVIFYLALRQIGASKTVPLSSIYPLFTVTFSALFLGESVSPKIIVGTILIIAGVVLVSEG
jgi:uncharacterized membrane protein